MTSFFKNLCSKVHVPSCTLIARWSPQYYDSAHVVLLLQLKQKKTKLAKFGLTSSKLKAFAEARAKMEAEKKSAEEKKKAESEENKAKKSVIIKKKKQSGPSTKGFSLMSGTLVSTDDEQKEKTRSKSPTKDTVAKSFAKQEPEIDEKQELINKMAAGVEFDEDDDFGEAPLKQTKSKKVQRTKQRGQISKLMKKIRKNKKSKGKQISPRRKTDEIEHANKDCTNKADAPQQALDEVDLNDFSAVAERRMWRSLQFALYLANLGK